MSLRLENDEDFNGGLKRLIAGECRAAIESIDKAGSDESRHEAVHEIRRSMMKIRACLRLVRDHIDDYKELDVFFRDLARRISNIRDATAGIETLEELREESPTRLDGNAFAGIRESLLARRERLADREFREKDTLAVIRGELSACLARIPRWAWKVEGFDDIRQGLRRVYRRGRAAFADSRDDGDIGDFHEWRKHVKYLRYQVDVLNRLWPGLMTTLENELHTLSDDIGNLHDLHVLRETVGELELEFDADDERGLFEALIAGRRERLARSALFQGARFYHPSPGDFCDAMECYWTVWHKEGDTSSRRKPEVIS